MTTTVIELPDELHAHVQNLAQATGRPIAELLIEAVAQGLAYDQWFRAEVAKGLHSTETEQFVRPEEVEAMWIRLTTPEAMVEAEAELGSAWS